MKRPLASLAAATCALALAGTAVAQSPLCTVGFIGGNGLSGDTLVFFDLNVTVPVIVQSIDTNCYAAGAVSIEIYTTPGTSVGVETTPAAWTLQATGSGTSAARDTPTNVVLNTPLLLSTGAIGMAIRSSNGHSYTNGTGANQNFATGELAIALGKSASVSGGVPFTGSPISPRIWNGCFNYVPASGLYAIFSGTPTVGASPLLVNFTDLSYSSDPSGVQSWAWDIDNDGSDDYFTQNCSHTYAASGKYSVKLTVTDLAFPAAVETKTDYITVDPITPDFTATPTAGNSPLFVNFTDTSVGTITSWAWDFDNDGTDDAFTQNPQWVFSAGTYSVKLTVSNSAFSESITKTDYIVVDAISADFTASPTLGAAPLLVNFTDTSTGPITSWAWDFDNDGTDDAFTQNPQWLYAATGQYSVKLTISNSGNSDTITKVNYIYASGQPVDPGAADVLQYQFNEPRGALVANSAVGSPAPAFGTVKAGSSTSLPNPNWQGDPGRSAWQGNEPGFGSLVADSTSPYESRVDSGWPFVFSGSHSIAFWIRPVTPGTSSASYAFGSGTGSARGYHTGSYLSLRSWGTLTSFVDSATDPDSLAGWHHWCMVVDDTAGTAQWFVDGLPDGAVVAFTPNTFTINLGNFIVGAYGTTTSLFTRYFDMDDFRFYGRALTGAEILGCMAKEQAAATTFGDGCAGPSGVPTIAANGQPTLGNAGFVINVDNTEVGQNAIILIGTLVVQGGLRPLDVSSVFGPGCLAETLSDLAAFPLGTGPNNAFPLGIPNVPALAGGHAYAQGFVFGTSGAVSPALDINLQL